MYNVYQFANRKEREEQQAKKEKELQEYHLKHQQYKKFAYQNLKKKSDDFLTRQLSSNNPSVIEDDHFQRWRKHRMFRDVEDQNKFISSKVFKHRPNEDMNKHYNERERRERSYLASKKESLVKSGVIPHEHISRSVASQGPYQPKIEFREAKKDYEYLQPRLRYSNITDEQRFNESDMKFDERLKSIYYKFEQKKLRVGKPAKLGYGLPEEPSYAISSENMRTTKSMSLRKNSFKGSEQPESEGLSAISSSLLIGEPKRKEKTYFKLAKMMQMFHPEQSKREELAGFLQKSQYTRRKDLTNIRSNSYNENFQKHPIK